MIDRLTKEWHNRSVEARIRINSREPVRVKER
jgi:hypothetical protein